MNFPFILGPAFLLFGCILLTLESSDPWWEGEQPLLSLLCHEEAGCLQAFQLWAVQAHYGFESHQCKLCLILKHDIMSHDYPLQVLAVLILKPGRSGFQLMILSEKLFAVWQCNP